MKRFWSFLLIILFLGFSAHAQAQKKGKKSYKKRHKTKIRQRHYFTACFFDLIPPQNKLPKADEELDENRDYLFTQVNEPPIFEVCKDNINKKKCFQNELEQHVKTHFNPNNIDAEKSEVDVAFRIDKEGNTEVLFSRSEKRNAQKRSRKNYQPPAKVHSCTKKKQKCENILYTQHYF